jgi:hypothetical protein
VRKISLIRCHYQARCSYSLTPIGPGELPQSVLSPTNSSPQAALSHRAVSSLANSASATTKLRALFFPEYSLRPKMLPAQVIRSLPRFIQSP